MKVPNTEQRDALSKLQFSRDGKVLTNYLQLWLEESTARVIADDDPHRVRMWQGECRALRELIVLLTPVSS